jgi:hypothetical protein
MGRILAFQQNRTLNQYMIDHVLIVSPKVPFRGQIPSESTPNSRTVTGMLQIAIRSITIREKANEISQKALSETPISVQK